MSRRSFLACLALIACNARTGGGSGTLPFDVPASDDVETSTDAAAPFDQPAPADLVVSDAPPRVDTPPPFDLGGGCAVGQTLSCVCSGGLRGDAVCLEGGVVGPCRCDGGVTDAPGPGCSYEVMLRCYTEVASGDVCPCGRVAQDSSRPQWRITALRPTRPAALASPVILSVISTPLRTGGFLTGIDYDIATNSLRFGALNEVTSMRGTLGLGLLDGSYRFFAGDAGGSNPGRHDPVRLAVMRTGTGFQSLPASGSTLLSVRDSSGSGIISLPLCASEISVPSLSMDRGCIGLGRSNFGRFNECTSEWDPTNGGVIRAVLTVSATRAVTIGALNQSLCQFLAGTSCDQPMNTWLRQPDTVGCGEPGWALDAAFAAVAARIAR